MSEILLRNWSIYEQAPPEFLHSVAEHPVLLQVLYNRGLRTADAVRMFLNGSDAVTEDPYTLQDMRAAVARILQALEQREIICVYGDFDADGVSATALLVTALQAAGGRVGPYIPSRVDEGYGLNLEAIETVAAKAKLMITVDCGIRSATEVFQANRLGLDVIVTDHHSIGAQLPPALAVINPHREQTPAPNKHLAGVGVAYRLAQAVLRAAMQQSWSQLTAEMVETIELQLLEFVALGTVADMMPLVGSNRWLVRRGLEQIKQSQRPGIIALKTQAGIKADRVDASTISFLLAPRLNAAGRLAHASLAYRLLRTNDPAEAFMATSQLEELNRKRQALTQAAHKEAETQLSSVLDADPALLFVQSRTIQQGIVGLVAGRLTDRFYRPTVVVEQGQDESRGSARSIAEFDISAALDELQSHLVRYGGHARAAGFTIKTSALSSFRQDLEAIAQRGLSDREHLRPTLYVDAVLEYSAIDWALQEQLSRLEPTGQDNSPALFLCHGLRVREARTVGGEGRHLKMIVDSGAGTQVLDAIAFRLGERISEVAEGTLVDLVFHLEVNEWQGRQSLQLNVQDFRVQPQDISTD